MPIINSIIFTKGAVNSLPKDYYNVIEYDEIPETITKTFDATWYHEESGNIECNRIHEDALEIRLGEGISYFVAYDADGFIQEAYCYLVKLTTREFVLDSLHDAETLTFERV